MKSALRSSLFAALAVAFGAHAALPPNPPESSLEPQLKISKMQARRLALDRSPQGTVKSEWLEQRGDQRVWVVEVTRYMEPTHITTVLVDADTGKIQSGTPHAPKKR